MGLPGSPPNHHLAKKPQQGDKITIHKLEDLRSMELHDVLCGSAEEHFSGAGALIGLRKLRQGLPCHLQGPYIDDLRATLIPIISLELKGVEVIVGCGRIQQILTLQRPRRTPTLREPRARRRMWR